MASMMWAMLTAMLIALVADASKLTSPDASKLASPAAVVQETASQSSSSTGADKTPRMQPHNQSMLPKNAEGGTHAAALSAITSGGHAKNHVVRRAASKHAPVERHLQSNAVVKVNPSGQVEPEGLYSTSGDTPDAQADEAKVADQVVSSAGEVQGAPTDSSGPVLAQSVPAPDLNSSAARLLSQSSQSDILKVHRFKMLHGCIAVSVLMTALLCIMSKWVSLGNRKRRDLAAKEHDQAVNMIQAAGKAGASEE